MPINSFKVGSINSDIAVADIGIFSRYRVVSMILHYKELCLLIINLILTEIVTHNKVI